MSFFLVNFDFSMKLDLTNNKDIRYKLIKIDIFINFYIESND